MPLTIGNHKYFDTQIEIWPVRTPLKGLCYKLFFKKSLSQAITDLNPIAIFVTSSFENDNIDKLKGIHVTVAENNTWQGIIEMKWPYSKIPSHVEGLFLPKVSNNYIVVLEKNFYMFI